MGVRTVHQQEAKAQLLVAVGRQPANPWTAAQAAGALPDQAELQAEIEAAANEKVGSWGYCGCAAGKATPGSAMRCNAPPASGLRARLPTPQPSMVSPVSTAHLPVPAGGAAGGAQGL